MTEGLGIRVAITVLASTQAGIAAVLGFADILPIEWKIVLVALSAALSVALNQIPSWQSAPKVDRATRRLS